MSAIFLSASIPIPGRGDYHETANPFLIQCAVRELVLAVVQSRKIVWGGHPAITPMIWSICEDLNVDYSQSVVLYQSLFFRDQVPDENKHFNNVVYTARVENDREASLQIMRQSMLSREDLTAAVFIGGMEGVEVEFQVFRHFHPDALVLPVSAPGGAARRLAEENGLINVEEMNDVDFARLFHARLGVSLKRYI